MSLISIDYTRDKKEGNIFECDKCHKKIYTNKERRYVLEISKSNIGKSGLNRVKKFDLCNKCIHKYLREGEL